MEYPGRAVRRNHGDATVVRAVQARLLLLGCGPIDVDGDFQSNTESAVKMFQSRAGVTADGVIGPVTWSKLFQLPLPTAPGPSTALCGLAVSVARSQLGTRELPGNRGPEVERFLASVGLGAGQPWCMAFVYWCFNQAANRLLIDNPLPKTGSVHRHWAQAPLAVKINPDNSLDDLRAIRPGAIFFIDHGNDKGHTGIVLTADGEGLHTIEGNTNINGSREGDGVRQRIRRFRDITLGYADYGLQ